VAFLELPLTAADHPAALLCSMLGQQELLSSLLRAREERAGARAAAAAAATAASAAAARPVDPAALPGGRIAAGTDDNHRHLQLLLSPAHDCHLAAGILHGSRRCFNVACFQCCILSELHSCLLPHCTHSTALTAGHLRPGGPRHDNDHVDFRSIRVAPTCQEVLSGELPFLPLNRWALVAWLQVALSV
jgi:hypothetical protein